MPPNLRGECSSKKGWRRVVALLKRKPTSTSPGPIHFVPLEILLEIVEELQAADLLNFSATSSQLHNLLLPRLYRLVCLTSSRTCRSTLGMLERRPYLCRYIRKLVVRPKYYLAWPPNPDDPLDVQTQAWVWEVITKLAPHLTRLETFEWDGPEIAGDVLWRALNQSCLALKRVFCTVGWCPVDSGCLLFQFENLTAFSLAARIYPGGAPDFPSREQLPSQLWKMLLERCPNLEDLTICSLAKECRRFDMREITQGRWPKLRALTLELTFPIASDSRTLSAEALQSFLEAHPTLERLSLYAHATHIVPAQEFPVLFKADSLPLLTSFVGVHHQVATIPFPERLHALDLVCSPMAAEDLRSCISHLARYTALTSLDVRLTCSVPHTLFAACPTIVHLRLIFEDPADFLVTTLAQALRALPCLRTLLLCRGIRSSETSPTMLRAAIVLLAHNALLEEINITYTNPAYPLSVEAEGSYAVQGRYLHVHERGFPINGGTFENRFRHELVVARRHGHGGVERYQEIGEREYPDSLKKVVHYSNWSQARFFVF